MKKIIFATALLTIALLCTVTATAQTSNGSGGTSSGDARGGGPQASDKGDQIIMKPVKGSKTSSGKSMPGNSSAKSPAGHTGATKPKTTNTSTGK